MAIIINEEAKTFTIHTEQSTYQMKVDSYGALLHTYFGALTDGSDYSYLIVPEDRGFCGQPSDVAGNERTYSMDFYPQEYPVHGNGDYRVPCLKANLKNRVPALDLRFSSYRTSKGKYNLPGLPAMFGGEEAETLEIVLKDLFEDIYVHLYYGVFAEKNIITRAAVVENGCGEPLEIKRAMSLCLDFMDNDIEMVHFYGKHACERQFERIQLPHGLTEICSRRGASSHQHNPFVIFCGRDTTEDFGSCCGVSLLYSGSYRIQAEAGQIEGTRVVCGMDDDEFCWTLQPGECFAVPEAVFSYTEKGFAALSNGLKDAFQENLVRSVWKERKRPTLVNSWEAAYFDFNAEKLLAIAGEAAELGLDMLVLDDGWFGRRNDDNAGLGDWGVNEEKLGCSLRELVDRINKLGLKFGIWVELEMVSEDSDLYRAHPDWAMVIPGREPNRGRNQLVLDLSRAEVRQYIKDAIDHIMASANIEYIKWDMNRSIDNVYSAAAPEAPQGVVRHQYILGLYEVLEYLHGKYPEVLVEGCSGGGGRYDAGMLYYTPQIWCSDNTDAVERLKIHYGTSFGYPMASVAAHVSECPNEQNHRVTPFQTRGICAMQGAFGYEMDLCAMPQAEKDCAKEQILVYNKHYKLFQQGDYYRLTSPFENNDVTVWSYVSKDKETAVLCGVYTDLHGNAAPARAKWKGLAEGAAYEVDGRQMTGAALMHGGIVLPKPACSYDSFMIFARKI